MKGIFTRNGKYFTAGNLYELLKRQVYIGKVVHKKQVYDGIHEPIVDVEIFNQVQDLLKENNKSNKQKVFAKEPSLLSGKLYDDNGNTMSPSHANKNGANRTLECRKGHGCPRATKRYRYYVSQAIMSKEREKQGSLPQIPAYELEEHSLQLIKQKLENYLKLENHSIEQYQLYKNNLENCLELWSLQNNEIHFIVRAIIYKVVISHINIIYYLNPKSLENIFNLIVTKQEITNYEVQKMLENECKIITLPCELKRVNQGKTLIIGEQQTTKNGSLIELLKKSWEWNERILKGESSVDIQQSTGFTKTYVNDILAMRFLSPEIQMKILKGEQPPEWTVHKLRRCKMSNFKEQIKILES